MDNVFINSHTQHPYATFGGNLAGGLLTYNMAASAAGHIPGLAQRIGGWSERLSTFPILRRIGQDHLSNIIGATIVDTGAFTVPKAIIDIYNGESSETVFRNAGVDIGRNVLFNIFGEAVSGAVGRVVQRFKGGSSPELGNKLDYLFGKAVGGKHNIERSVSMENSLNRIGIFDNASGREYLSSHLNQVLNDASNISNTEIRSYIAKELPGCPEITYTAVTKESLLMGPYGGLKLESVWDGNRLLTIVIKGGN